MAYNKMQVSIIIFYERERKFSWRGKKVRAWITNVLILQLTFYNIRNLKRSLKNYFEHIL